MPTLAVYHAICVPEAIIGQIASAPWGAAQYLAELIRTGQLTALCGHRTRLLILHECGRLCAFLTLARLDEIRDTPLTPWAGFVFTFPADRHHRYVGHLLQAAESIAAMEGASTLYISTDADGLYEHFGYTFSHTDRNMHGEVCRIYAKSLVPSHDTPELAFLMPACLEEADREWQFIRDLPKDENGFMNAWEGCDKDTFLTSALPEMLAHAKGHRLPEGYVPCTSFFLWSGPRIAGLFRLRHHLTPTLQEGAGHIGYTVHPDFRGKGYGTVGLRRLITLAPDIIPEDTLRLRCFSRNPASLHVMLHNGAQLLRQDDETCFTAIPISDVWSEKTCT